MHTTRTCSRKTLSEASQPACSSRDHRAEQLARRHQWRKPDIHAVL